MAGESILVIDDEEEIGDLLSLYLKREGFLIEIASTGQNGIQQARKCNPNLIILDVFLPDIDGHEVCRKLRAFTDAPILFLSCKDTEVDKVIGLSIGADDYISKPFGLNELMARVKVHLRRSQKWAQQEQHKDAQSNSLLTSSSITLDTKRYEAFLNQKPLSISTKEFQLLAFFMSHRKQVLSPAQLLDHIWGYEEAWDTTTVKVHIRNLRKKIEEDPHNPQKIVTIRGVGYRFDEEE